MGVKESPPSRKLAIKHRAAMVIQAAFRGHLTREYLKTHPPPPPVRKKRTSYDRAHQLARERSLKSDSYYKSDSIDRLSSHQNERVMSLLMTNVGPDRKKTSQDTHL